MSTRSQILFKDVSRWSDGDGDEIVNRESVLTYKHHDGYVRSTVPTLREFFQYAKSRSNDIEYFVASWCYWIKRKRERWMRERDGGDLDLLEEQDAEEFQLPKVLTGIGVCGSNHLHGDIEHFYIVDLDEGKIVHYHSHFPDYDTYEELISNREPDNVFELDVDDLEEGIES